MTMPSLVLTIDIDWAHDAVIADTLAIVAQSGVAATWFATHASALLQDIRSVPRQEVGMHPNFNPLLDGSGSGSASGIIGAMRAFLPDAVSIRSHSLTRSSRLATLFVNNGLTHESNHLLPPRLGNVTPWRDFCGLVQVPIRWEDDVRLLDAALGEPAEHVGQVTPLVVDFHPIHVFLNTASIRDYEDARGHADDPAALLARRRPEGSGGSRDRLVALLACARASGDDGTRIADLVAGEA